MGSYCPYKPNASRPGDKHPGAFQSRTAYLTGQALNVTKFSVDAAMTRHMHLNRFQAAGIHLALSALVASLLLAVIYLVWYPHPFFEVGGGEELLLLIVGVDVTLGPLLTLIVFKPGKPGLKFDLSVIVIAQLAALLYGAHVMFQARPVFVVFATDRLTLISAGDIQDEFLAKASRPEWSYRSLTGPRLVAVKRPEDPKLRETLLFEVLNGAPDLDRRPQYYVPFDEAADAIRKRLNPLSDLNPSAETEAREGLEKAGLTEADVGWLPMVSITRTQVVVMHRESLELLDAIAYDPWEQPAD